MVFGNHRRGRGRYTPMPVITALMATVCAVLPVVAAYSAYEAFLETTGFARVGLVAFFVLATLVGAFLVFLLVGTALDDLAQIRERKSKR
jgi:anaerobic C4-dicarboxylate transporter